MSVSRLPKVLLFDIGGVCVVSPFQRILDFEKANKIPLGYINYSISKTSPNGTWHKLERGEIKLDEDYFHNFKADLENEQTWRDYNAKLKIKAKTTALVGAEALTAVEPAPVPSVDAENLFWSMMSVSSHPDPYISPVLQKLKACGKFTLAALSNTVIVPPGSPVSAVTQEDLKDIFDVVVSSAHVGMRKPDPKIYEYTLQKLQARVGPDLKAEDVLFLDDIGENLKAAKACGMRTLRVWLGKTDLAVKELENILNMDLSHGRQCSKPKL